MAGLAGCSRMRPGLAIELLQGDVGAADEGDHHLAVVGRAAILDDHEIAVANLLVHHRVALDAQDVGVLLADQILRDGDRFVGRDGLDRRAGRDVAEQRQFDRPVARAGRQQFHRSAAIPGAADAALFLEVGQVLVDGRQRRQAEPAPNFLEAGRVALLLDEIPEVVENLALAFGQWLHLSLRKKWAKLGCDYTQRKGENQPMPRKP